MIGYLKGGIVTRIDEVNNSKETKEYIKKYFDLNLFEKTNNSYLLKEKILNKNIKKLREELLNITENNSDSIENSDAYLLETTAEKLLEKEVYLIENNKKYYFNEHKSIKFETDVYEIKDKKIHIILSVITIIWNTDKIEIEDKEIFEKFINNLIRKSVTNVLKNTLWFTITR